MNLQRPENQKTELISVVEGRHKLHGKLSQKTVKHHSRKNQSRG